MLEATVEWLNKEPAAEEVREIKPGVFVLPYKIVEEKLNVFTDSRWSEEDFQYSFHVLEMNPYLAASIKLILPIVDQDGSTYIRTLVGTITRKLEDLRTIGKDEFEEDDLNEHYTATAKSLCKVNAVKTLGRTFGKYLNEPKSEESNPDNNEIVIPGNKSIRDQRINDLIENIKSAPNKIFAQHFIDKAPDLAQEEEVIKALAENFTS